MSDEQNHQSQQDAIKAKLIPFVQQVMEGFGVAGLAIGIVKDRALIYAQGFGVRNVATGEAVTPQSLFHMASISKPFVATAMMQLVEQGKIVLDAPVVTYLPYFQMGDERYRHITVQQMLNHTAGMPDVEDYRWYEPEYDDGALERFVRSLSSMKLLHAPGEKYAYSNAAFEVLGDVVAKVSGESFEGYIKQHILDPLHMHASTFLHQEVDAKHAATPHFGLPLTTLPNAYPYHRAHAPSSTLHSNIMEMSQWAIANLNRGSLGDATILQPESYERLWQRDVETGEEIWQEAVGLSWFFGSYRDQQIIHHGGSDPGFLTDLSLLPELGAAVVVMANSNTAPVSAIADATLDILLGLEPQVPLPSAALPVAATLATKDMAAAGEHYHRLHQEHPHIYDFKPSRFNDACWGAIETHNAEHVLPLLHLWLEVQPESSEAHELMGWANLVQGRKQEAAEYLRRALELDAENNSAAKLMNQLMKPNKS